MLNTVCDNKIFLLKCKMSVSIEKNKFFKIWGKMEKNRENLNGKF